MTKKNSALSYFLETPKDLSHKHEVFYKKWVKSYFNGSQKPFPIKNLDLSFGTPFQQKIWRELSKIPFGKTISYKELARRAGKPRGYRAAGNANGKNPYPLIIPCHRVIAADGKIGGYSLGLSLKRELLKVEGLTI